MRLVLVLACLMVFIVPSLIVIGIKRYRRWKSSRRASRTRIGRKRGEVLFFNASWCGPCRQMKPIVSELRHKGFHFRDVDVDKNQNLAAKYGVRRADLRVCPKRFRSPSFLGRHVGRQPAQIVQ